MKFMNRYHNNLRISLIVMITIYVFHASLS